MRRVAPFVALVVAVLSLSACGKQRITWRPDELAQEAAVKAVMVACKTDTATWGSLLAAHYDGTISPKDADFLSAFSNLLAKKARTKDVGIADILGASSELGCTTVLLGDGKAAIGHAADKAGQAADEATGWLKSKLQ